MIPLSTLAQILELLTRVRVDELTERFVELFHLATSLLGEDDQKVAQEALADLRAGNDLDHARLQARLAEAKNR